jgi:ribosomal protein L9
VDKRKIQLSEPIRAYGKFDLDVKLYTDVTAKVHVLVCN